MSVQAPKAVVALVASVLALGLTACGGASDNGSGTSAANEKKITVYSGRSESLVKPLLDKFTQQSGIVVEARYAATAAMAGQLLEEGDRSPADAFFAQDAGALGAVAKKGMFAPLPDEIVGQVPETYRAKSKEWVGITARSRVLVYNPDLVPKAELPTSVFDLTKPEWKGKVGVAPTNASFQAFVTAIVVQHGEAKAKELLAGLKANEPQIRDGNGPILEEVNSGKLAVGLINHYYLGELAKEQGTTPDALTAKLHFFPNGDSGALVNVAGVGVLKKAAESPEVQTFVKYLLSADAQKYFAEETFEYPVVSGAAPPAGVPPLSELRVPTVDLNDLDQLEATIALIKDSGLVP
ncbi:iron ABC transporter substrate-binding protein [Nonomuraea cavernae]|uniref:Iron ABC transporter substrate-binding protein n=1 Tax=Nonomuraea cavernae TaxID=2045107 RepID=A0A918DF50_9ACTN|nr:iron ABC transporter substrate-binding protein [Nonomuraea cavernae]MCA2183907.1 iron ABC transporter substrate-binding protein [Nonomuraea cavernae]GGO61732.1 iron ABC transporter substrate-binding protein [Nonomuraea cavernae]